MSRRPKHRPVEKGTRCACGWLPTPDVPNGLQRRQIARHMEIMRRDRILLETMVVADV